MFGTSQHPAQYAILRRMGAITDLWKSERGLVALVLLISATVLEGLGHLTSDQWVELVKWVLTVYVGGKTVTSVTETITRAKTAAANETAANDTASAPTADAPKA